MKFGLFGSAQAQRGGPDLDSGQGFRDYVDYNVEAEALGYNSIFVVEHHFTGFGQVSASLNSADLARGAHQDAAARHRGDGAAVAQSRCCWPSRPPPSTCCPAGGSTSASARAIATTSSRASAFRGRGRRALRGGPRAHHQVVDDATSASRITASTGTSRTSSSSRRRSRSRIRRSGWRPAIRIRSARWRGAAPSCCSTSLPRRARPSSGSTSTRPRSRACGRRFDPMDVAVSRAFYRGQERRGQGQGRSRPGSPTSRGWRSSRKRRTATASRSMLSFDQTLDAAGRQRDVRHAGRDRREAGHGCAPPASSTCCSTVRPARARTSAPSPATSCRRSPDRRPATTAAAAARERRSA